MTHRPLQPDDRPVLEALLRNNPYKQIQIQLQELDPHKLVQFHTESILSQSEDPDSPIWLFERGERFGIIGCHFCETHSSFFDVPIYSIEPVVTYRLRTEEKLELFSHIGDILEARGARIVWGKCEDQEGDLASCLIQMGGAFCGTGVRLSRKISDKNRPAANPALQIRFAHPEDLPALKLLAGRNHTHSHFFRDPNLPDERKKNIFPSYLEKCYGQPHRPLLAACGENNEILGFSLLLCPARQEEKLGQTVGIVDFIVVRTDLHGQGVGSSLLAASLDLLEERGYRYVELKTMLDNFQAINFYQKQGFRLLSAEMHFSIGGILGKWM